MKKKVLVTALCDEKTQKQLVEQFNEEYEFFFAFDDQELAKETLPHAEILIGAPEEEELEAAKSLKWLQLPWAGYDKFAAMKNFPKGVAVTNASGAFGVIISEYVIGSLVSLYRSFPRYWSNQKEHIWHEKDNADTIFRKKVLILGTGDLGSNVAKRIKAFDTEVIGLRKNPKANTAKHFDSVLGLEDLDSLLGSVDIVVGCLPSNSKTEGLFDYDRLMKMKKDAVIINVGRGTLIKTEDLIKVLSEGHLRGAILDVTEVEPLPEDCPLWDMDNVIITPHMSGPSYGDNEDVVKWIWDISIENLRRYLKEEELTNKVSF